MGRKNIWDIIGNQEVDICNEYKSLWYLFHNEKLINNPHGYNETFAEIAREKFLNFKTRGSITSYDNFLQVLKLRPLIVKNGQELENLDLLIELILLVLSELDDLQVPNIKNGIQIISDTILSILEKTNQKIISLEDEKMIVVPNDEVITIVADLILPDDEKLALEVLGYSHYSNKDNLIEKRKILNSLANYLEPKLKLQKNDEIGFVLNNYYIRHGNRQNKQNIERLSDEDMNSLYDKLYRDILYYLLEQEHEDYKILVKKLKKNM